jgi:hypothetical protein
MFARKIILIKTRQGHDKCREGERGWEIYKKKVSTSRNIPKNILFNFSSVYNLKYPLKKVVAALELLTFM